MFAVTSNATKVIDRLLRLDATTDSNYSPFPVFCRPAGTHNRLLREHKTPSHLPKHSPTLHPTNKPGYHGNSPGCRLLTNSTPLFSQLSLATLNVGGDMSPIIPEPVVSLQFDSPPASPMKFPTNKPATTKTSEKDHQSQSESYSKVDLKRGKRRRCRVQCMVVDPPTQNNPSINMSVEIRPPKNLNRLSLELSDSTESLESEDEKKEMKTDETSRGVLIAKKLDDTEPLQLPLYPHTSVSGPGDVSYIEPEVIAELMRSDDSIFDLESDKENTDPCCIKKDCSDTPTSQDFDSFDMDNIREIIELEAAEKKNSNAHSSRNQSNGNSPGCHGNTSGYHGNTSGSSQECGRVSSNCTTAAPSNTANETGSEDDLFGAQESSYDCDHIPQEEEEEKGARPRKVSKEDTFEWSMLSQMSSQEISKHFDFRLSESDGDEGDDSEAHISDCSAELF